MSFLKVANRAISTLASGVNDVVTEWTVATGGGALFPSSGDFHITCEDEIVKCTSRTGDVLTVTRAQEGTAAAAHDADKAVKLRITAGVIEDIQNQVLLRPTGTGWENRTYSGMELVTANTTYTIGSGKDFATLAACASALNGLIIAGCAVTIQLQEDITITSTVTFAGILAIGGYLRLDLNGHDINMNLNDEGIIFDGLNYVHIADDAAGGSQIIATGSGSCSTSTRFLQYQNGCMGNIYHVEFDLNGETIKNFLYALNGARLIVADTASFVDDAGGGTVTNAVKVANGAEVYGRVTLGIGADDLDIVGAMVIDSDGDIHTSGGQFEV